MVILHCLVLLNSVLFKPCLFQLELLRKLSIKDMVAQDSYYHNKCLSSFYRCIPEHHAPTSDENKDRSSAHAISLAKVVAYIEHFQDESPTAPVYTMAYLTL